MSGPFQASTEIVQQMKQLGCFEVLPPAQFHEACYVAKAWVRPKEDGRHGSFLYLKEDGSATKYEVSSKVVFDSYGNVEPLCDLIEPQKFDISQLLDQNFITVDYLCRSEITSLYLDMANHLLANNYTNEFHNGRNIFHEACSIKLNDDDYDLFQQLLHSATTMQLLEEDDFGMTPLHYACRFLGDDVNLIATLLQKSPAALHMCDKFGRYPLHLACASNAVPDVILLLIEYQSDDLESIVWIPTKILKRVALHIALENGASKESIQALLDADNEKESVLERTYEGRLPLHIGVENRASGEVIDLLIRADLQKIKKAFTRNFMECML